MSQTGERRVISHGCGHSANKTTVQVQERTKPSTPSQKNRSKYKDELSYFLLLDMSLTQSEDPSPALDNVFGLLLSSLETSLAVNLQDAYERIIF